MSPRVFVLDTNVLMHDPTSIFRFAEHHVFLPMVVLEAMAAGLPVVATRVEGVPELVRDGIDGLLASPNSADELAACIGRFVRGEADWHRMRRAAFTRQSADFSDESMARLVASTYRQVLGDLAP